MEMHGWGGGGERTGISLRCLDMQDDVGGRWKKAPGGGQLIRWTRSGGRQSDIDVDVGIDVG